MVKVKLTQNELNDIQRASLMLKKPDDWSSGAIRAVSRRLGELVKRIKAIRSGSENGEEG